MPDPPKSAASGYETWFCAATNAVSVAGVDPDLALGTVHPAPLAAIEQRGVRRLRRVPWLLWDQDSWRQKFRKVQVSQKTRACHVAQRHEQVGSV